MEHPLGRPHLTFTGLSALWQASSRPFRLAFSSLHAPPVTSVPLHQRGALPLYASRPPTTRRRMFPDLQCLSFAIRFSRTRSRGPSREKAACNNAYQKLCSEFYNSGLRLPNRIMSGPGDSSCRRCLLLQRCNVGFAPNGGAVIDQIVLRGAWALAALLVAQKAHSRSAFTISLRDALVFVRRVRASTKTFRAGHVSQCGLRRRRRPTGCPTHGVEAQRCWRASTGKAGADSLSYRWVHALRWEQASNTHTTVRHPPTQGGRIAVGPGWFVEST